MRSTLRRPRTERLSALALTAAIVLLLAACTEPAGGVRTAAPTGSLAPAASETAAPTKGGY